MRIVFLYVTISLCNQIVNLYTVLHEKVETHFISHKFLSHLSNSIHLPYEILKLKANVLSSNIVHVIRIRKGKMGLNSPMTNST